MRPYLPPVTRGSVGAPHPQQPFHRGLGAGQALGCFSESKTNPRALRSLSLVWHVEGPVSWCPYSPCRSPSLEKGFHYTSESVSSGLKSDPDGLSCIWALFFVGPKVAGLRNAFCLGLFQIKSRIFRVHVLISPERKLGAHGPLGTHWRGVNAGCVCRRRGRCWPGGA